ncbi:MAG: hypothetical protein FJ137_13485 [Deltaproteobacteria bacterium]|nr:hypothetical protein [Deltaproteobacteria bacterium]
MSRRSALPAAPSGGGARRAVGLALTVVGAAACLPEDPPPDPPPPPVPATVTFAKAGNGRGELRTLPVGLLCDVDCGHASFTFEDVAAVTVVVEPARDALFRGLACVPSADGIEPVRLDALDDEPEARLTLATIVGDVGVDWTCTATFLQVQTLQVLLPGEGSGRVRGALSAVVGADEPRRIECPGDCVGAYFVDETETLTAEPDDGSMFVGWRFCGEGTAPLTLAMNRDHNCDAVFEPASP